MHKKTKWAITALILVVAIGLGTYRLMREKKPDAGIDAPPASSRANILNVNAQIVREQELSDGIFTIASVVLLQCAIAWVAAFIVRVIGLLVM